MKETNVPNKIVIAERDNIAAVMENGKVSEFYVHRGEIILGDVYLAQQVTSAINNWHHTTARLTDFPDNL